MTKSSHSFTLSDIEMLLDRKIDTAIEKINTQTIKTIKSEISIAVDAAIEDFAISVGKEFNRIHKKLDELTSDHKTNRNDITKHRGYFHGIKDSLKDS